ncbi:MAG: electron transport complex subunit RsxC [Myxococcales bacterium]|nr:electron transport complex subunit RsxC [Myxococcales bacterium]
MSWGLPTFRHGVHPPENKEATESLPIERVPFVREYVLPLAQHIGRPAKAVVEVKDRVERGALIAEPDGFVSTAIHAPVTGTVTAIELRPHPSGKLELAIVIEADPFANQRMPKTSGLGDLSDIVGRVQRGGLVGLGGAAFPSHVKLSLPEGKRVSFVIINGCECEPYLTCDHRVMAERPQAVVRGLQIMMEVLGAERGYLGIEANKPDAIEALRAAIRGHRGLEVVPLAVKYPQGAEKMLIDAILEREVPAGGLPLDLEIVVNNSGTAAALADLIDDGLPLIERVVTVTGPGVRRPANLLVPIGTPLMALLEHCDGLRPETRQVVLGGPMMGQAQKRLDIPILKGTSGVLALTEVNVEAEQPCIRCGRCLEACPMFLNPSRLALLVRAEQVDALESSHQMSCFECASCSYVCPSRIPLVQLMRVGKGLLREAAGR